MKLSKVLVIGSNSFTGLHFVKLLLSKKIKTIGISRSKIFAKNKLPFDKNDKNFKFYKLDINSNQKKIIKLIKNFKPSHIINFASQSMVGESWIDPDDWFFTNSFSTCKLYNNLSKLNFKFRLVHITTPEVYGSVNGKIVEDRFFNPTTPYAISRTTADYFLRALYKAGKIDYISTRAANVFGDYQSLYRIVPKAIFYIIKNKKLILHGGGKSIRSFIYVDDVCEATFKLMKKNKLSYREFHISNNEFVSISKLVRTVCEMMNYDYEKLVIAGKDRLGKDKFYKLSQSRIYKEIKWKSRFSYKDGIKKTIVWLKNYHKFYHLNDATYHHKK
jgi:dTDP-glucose 4,6-dehydratase